MEQAINNQVLTLEELEKLYILDILRKNENNKVLTAKLLGISTKTLYNKLNKYFEVKENTEE